MEELHGNRILIVGFGREGQSVLRYLRRHHPECRVAIADKRAVDAGTDRDVEIYSGENYLEQTAHFDTIVRSPGISLKLPQLQEALRQGVKITSATRLFMAQVPGRVIGVTGTKGKSTTSTLIAAVLSSKYPDVRLVGNIGIPSLDNIENASADTLFVCEFSSFQLDDMEQSPHAAVLLGIHQEHLDYHGSLQAYISAKSNITRWQTESDWLLYNPSLPESSKIAGESRARKVVYGSREGAAFSRDGALWLRTGKEAVQLLPIADLPLIGAGNVQNALAAAALGMVFGVPAGDIAAALRSFKPLPHRLEPAGSYAGITFYNDSLSTIPQAAINALDGLGEKTETVILGGHDRSIDYRPLGERIAASSVKTLILFPDTGKRIWEAVRQAAKERCAELPAHFFVSSMEEAVAIAYEQAHPGTICLLSPASSSLNMFANYEERGEAFKHFVKLFGAAKLRDLQSGDEKTVVRRQMREVLAGDKQLNEKSRMIAEHLLKLAEIEAARRVGVYMSKETEVETRQTVLALLRSGKEVAAPYCSGESLQFVRIFNLDELEPGAFGILEPKPEFRVLEERRFPLEKLDVVIIPGVAFDRSGNRLGRGKGYYDRLLSKLQPGTFRVGLAYESQIVAVLPCTHHDEKVHAFITEHGGYFCEARK